MIDHFMPDVVSSVLAAYLNKVNGCLNWTWCSGVWQWFVILQVKKHMDHSTHTQ